ncbi:MAG: hypothetical protein ACREIC_09415, partial [Limisphaerales bacterium]
MRILLSAVVLALCLTSHATHAAEEAEPLHFAIIGLSHDHAAGFIPRALGRKDIELAGIVESKPELISRYAQRFHLGKELFFPTLDDLIAHTNVQAVAT